MTTGTFPTFLDIRNNFASDEITEDNIIYQLKKSGKKLIFMGDDTWISLFPSHFHQSYPFPSFVVKDLHTVDNGVIQNLIPSMKKKEWDVIVAHFLGVDHVGTLFFIFLFFIFYFLFFIFYFLFSHFFFFFIFYFYFLKRSQVLTLIYFWTLLNYILIVNRYGPDHKAMKSKLLQMNEILKQVVEEMDEETVLFVMGGLLLIIFSFYIFTFILFNFI